MVVIPVDGGVVYTTDINDRVAFLELCGVAGANEGGGIVGGKQAEQING